MATAYPLKFQESQKSLQEIFGNKLPEKATNFHTVGEVAVFVVTDTKATPVTQYVEVPFNVEQKALLQQRGILGTFGWALQ